jgi:hypothetical protein
LQFGPCSGCRFSSIKDLRVGAAAEQPEVLADQLALILEGAIVTAQVSQNPNAARTVKGAAKVLIEQMLASSQKEKR